MSELDPRFPDELPAELRASLALLPAPAGLWSRVEAAMVQPSGSAWGRPLRLALAAGSLLAAAWLWSVQAHSTPTLEATARSARLLEPEFRCDDPKTLAIWIQSNAGMPAEFHPGTKLRIIGARKLPHQGKKAVAIRFGESAESTLLIAPADIGHGHGDRPFALAGDTQKACGFCHVKS